MGENQGGGKNPSGKDEHLVFYEEGREPHVKPEVGREKGGSLPTSGGATNNYGSREDGGKKFVKKKQTNT